MKITIFDLFDDVETINGKKSLSLYKQGSCLYDLLKEKLKEIELSNSNDVIELSFSHLDVVTSHFLYSSVGLLISNRDFSVEFIKQHLKIIDVDDLTKHTLNKVMANAIKQLSQVE